MRIAVLAKQIPRPAELTLAGGRMVRDGVGTETNAYCRRANARAVQLAGEDGEVVIFSMGPPGAAATLREMIACGASRGVLVTDPALAGSDTLITARVLAAAVRQEGPFDLVLAGAYSLDSETGHVGIQLAEILGLPFVGPCRTLDVIDGVAVATVEYEGGYVDAEVLLPAVASAAERLCPPSKGSPDQVAAVPGHLIRLVSAAGLGLNDHEVGQHASPTSVGPAVPGAGLPRLRRKTSSVEQALALLGPLAGQAGPPAMETGEAGPPAMETGEAGPPARETGEAAPPAVEACPPSGHSAPVWCVPDPATAWTGPALLDAVAAIGRQAGRRTVAVAGALVDAPHTGAPGGQDSAQEMGLDGPGAPEDWVGPLAERLRVARPHCVVIEGTGWGREVAARTAARLGWGLVGDAVELTVAGAEVIAWKAALSGQSMVPVTSSSPTLLVTVRPGTLGGPPAGAGSASAETVPVTSRAKVIYSAPRGVDTAGRELSRARRLVVVGAGVDPQDYDSVRELCDLLGAGPLGASRKVTDQGWLPRSRQIGITGRSVAPELLVSIGASGGFNHCAGFRRAARVLAINRDPEAPIFDQADVGIVGDWREVVAQLCAALRARHGGDANAVATAGRV